MDGDTFSAEAVDKMTLVSAKSTREFQEGETFGTVMCLCNKRKPVTDFSIKKSSQVHYIENVCQGCKHTASALALLVCARCKDIIVGIPPHRDKAGFALKAGVVYHVASCYKCVPGTETAKIIERVVFDAQNKKT